MIHKVHELDSVDGVLTPVLTHYFCTDLCMDSFLAKVEKLWSEVALPDEDKDKVCAACGANLSGVHDM